MLLTEPVALARVPSPALLYPWYAIRTKSNQERIASQSLTNKGYVSFLPTYLDPARRGSRSVPVERPLFPGYFFCRFDVKLRMPILTTPGIVSVLGCAGEPLSIPENEIEAIQTVLRSGSHAEPYPFLCNGQKIRVTHGCFSGLEGILIEQKSSWRLVVSVTLLQRSVSVEIDRNLVAVA